MQRFDCSTRGEVARVLMGVLNDCSKLEPFIAQQEHDNVYHISLHSHDTSNWTGDLAVWGH